MSGKYGKAIKLCNIDFSEKTIERKMKLFCALNIKVELVLKLFERWRAP